MTPGSLLSPCGANSVPRQARLVLFESEDLEQMVGEQLCEELGVACAYNCRGGLRPQM
ncbi:MAG: hypothetical protein K6T86_08885 [Pirellulales bacterium]|nr:hypothetical protein [Pirellulales bacterium]